MPRIWYWWMLVRRQNRSNIRRSFFLYRKLPGCEYGGYTSDITRTWPISGSFTQPQLVLYQIVHTVQKELIDELLKDGGLSLDSLFDTMCVRLGIYLQEIGLVRKDLRGTELARAAYSYCPHHVSHYLGMDVHDTGSISRSIQLQPGMVCTVEPGIEYRIGSTIWLLQWVWCLFSGIYISHDRNDVPEEFRGIGIRIEDDVLITSDSTVEVLTEKCVKDPMLLAKKIISWNWSDGV